MIRNAVKILRKAEEIAFIQLRYCCWRLARRKAVASRRIDRHKSITSILIVPSDPDGIVGSRGDDAMVTTAIEQVRSRNPGCRIGILSRSSQIPELLSQVEVVMEPIWHDYTYSAYVRLLSRYDAVLMIGADVMDGHYSVKDAVRFWSLLDLAARAGLRSIVLGFSFSSGGSRSLAPLLRSIHPDIYVNTRDAVSMRNFRDMSQRTPNLVADCAFLLEPRATGPGQSAVDRWCAEQRSALRVICAFNTHPMIFDDCSAERVSAINKVFADAMVSLANREPVSYLLIPHDFRDRDRGDNASLDPLYRILSPAIGERIHFARQESRASELKAIVGASDMLITGRMHLGVAALSMGVPMWAVNSQDKFIGLFEHFGLPDLRLSPDEALQPDRFRLWLDQAFKNRAATAAQVRSMLPAVRMLAAETFSPFGPSSQRSGTVADPATSHGAS